MDQELRVSARDLQVGDVLPGEGAVTHIYEPTPGVVSVELDWNVLRGPWNHGDPVNIRRAVAS